MNQKTNNNDNNNNNKNNNNISFSMDSPVMCIDFPVAAL